MARSMRPRRSSASRDRLDVLRSRRQEGRDLRVVGGPKPAAHGLLLDLGNQQGEAEEGGGGDEDGHVRAPSRRERQSGGSAGQDAADLLAATSTLYWASPSYASSWENLRTRRSGPEPAAMRVEAAMFRAPDHDWKTRRG